MKNVFTVFLVLIFVTSSFAQQDVTSPGDPIIGIPDNGSGNEANNGWPAGEPPAAAIDNSYGSDGTTKFLHFYGDEGLTGFCTTPSSSQTVVTGAMFATANDASNRDPMTFSLFGSNDATLAVAGTWTPIIEDVPTGLPEDRFTQVGPIVFANTVAYDHYMVMFPTIRGSGHNSMQIGEVELLSDPVNGWPPMASIPANVSINWDDVDPVVLQLTAEVTDYDSGEEDMIYGWSLKSGPSGPVFDPADALTTNVTFTQPGQYVLRFTATDENSNSATGDVNIWVRSASDNILLAHWSFNEGSGTDIFDSTANDMDGTLGSYETGGVDPNFIPGWIPSDAPNNYALDIQQFGFVEVLGEDMAVSDPNLLQWGQTITAWFNAADWNGNRRILQKGATDTQFRLLDQSNKLTYHLSGVGTVAVSLPTAGEWHHVAATYNSTEMKIYVDGFEVASEEMTGLIDTTEDSLYIGCKNKTVNANNYPNDYFKGQMDDVRLYSYALDDAAIQELAAAGENAAPSVTVNELEGVVMVGLDYELSAVVLDVNESDVINYNWTVTGPSASFDQSDVAAPVVTFADVGSYTIECFVNDGTLGLDDSISDTITVEVINADCLTVIENGLGLLGDFDEDCDVDLEDFAAFAANFLECNDPQGGAGCSNPFLN